MKTFLHVTFFLVLWIGGAAVFPPAAVLVPVLAIFWRLSAQRARMATATNTDEILRAIRKQGRRR